MAKTPQDEAGAPHPDLLAAVVLHTLVSAPANGLTREEVVRACERDPTNQGERLEVDGALAILLADGLAEQVLAGPFAQGAESERFRATHAARRASELSF